MSRTTLILADALLIVVILMTYETGDLKKYPVILTPFIIVAFATCVMRHINYYNMTKKIF